MKRESHIWSPGTRSDLGAKKRRFASLTISTRRATLNAVPEDPNLQAKTEEVACEAFEIDALEP